MTSTTASTWSGRLPTLADIERAVEAIERLPPPPPNEVRLHPDDIAELRAAPGCVLAFNTLYGFRGIRVVADTNAKRLPRKPR